MSQAPSTPLTEGCRCDYRGSCTSAAIAGHHYRQHPLLAELRLLSQARLLLPLGNIAFAACLRACRALGLSLPTPSPRFGHGLYYHLSDNLGLLASYHPSQQNTQTGHLTRQMFHDIFAMARALLNAPRPPTI
jgi:uracil-DNA glycosylase